MQKIKNKGQRAQKPLLSLILLQYTVTVWPGGVMVTAFRLGKLFTHVPLGHQAVNLVLGQRR